MKIENKKELHDILQKAIVMARAAGGIQLSFFRKKDLVSATKLNSFDVVTEADKESERFIKEYIKLNFPDHGILSEESEEEREGADWRWIIDPLDGTTNFNAGLPVFCVSIALEYKGETQIGVIYLPKLDELFTSVIGEGSYLNGRRIFCSECKRLDEAVVATGMPYDRSTNPDNNLKEINNVVCKVRGTRRMGAAAVDLCYTAAGYLDAYWELNLHPWDVAAGTLIAREAGVEVVSIRKDRNVSILASVPSLMKDMKRLLFID